MTSEAKDTGALHPVVPSAEESTPHGEVGQDQYTELKRYLKLEASIDFAVEARLITTYKPVAKASGWFWRDQKFHFALGVVSKTSIASGGGAKSAVVTRADNNGKPTRPGRQFFTMLEEARPKLKIERLTSGEYDPTSCENAWLHEMELLGFDVNAFIPSSQTYFAVLHGEPGNQTFAPMRHKPGVNQFLFTFDGPPFADDESLQAYFVKRFLPLSIVYFEDGEANPSDAFPNFLESVLFASALHTLHDDVRILTKDGREVWRSRLKASGGKPAINEIEVLTKACALQGIVPPQPLQGVHDFKACVLQQFWHPGEPQKEQQLGWLGEAVRQAKKGSVPGVVECIKQVRALS